MKNCFFKPLRAEFSARNIPVFNGIEIHIPQVTSFAADTNWVRIDGASKVVAESQSLATNPSDLTTKYKELDNYVGNFWVTEETYILAFEKDDITALKLGLFTEFDMKYLEDTTHLTALVSNKSGSILRGSLNVLNGNSGLTELLVPYHSELNGNLNDLLDSMFAAGRTDGSIIVSAPSTNVMYNGVVFPNVASKTFDFTVSGWSERQ